MEQTLTQFVVMAFATLLVNGGLVWFIVKKVEKALSVQVRGTNPNTGQDVDYVGNCLAIIPTLLIDNTQKQRETGAAVESFRNEMKVDNATSQAIQIAAIQEMKNVKPFDPKDIPLIAYKNDNT
jgi:hypothetical protein